MWELLIGWRGMVIRVLRTRRSPHQLALPLPPTIHQLTNIPTMSRSNLRNAAPFQFLSSHVAREMITPWDCCKFPCARCPDTIVWSMRFCNFVLFCPQKASRHPYPHNHCWSPAFYVKSLAKVSLNDTELMARQCHKCVT